MTHFDLLNILKGDFDIPLINNIKDIKFDVVNNYPKILVTERNGKPYDVTINVEVDMVNSIVRYSIDTYDYGTVFDAKYDAHETPHSNVVNHVSIALSDFIDRWKEDVVDDLKYMTNVDKIEVDENIIASFKNLKESADLLGLDLHLDLGDEAFEKMQGVLANEMNESLFSEYQKRRLGLTEELCECLVGSPETGMGYQVVDVVLNSGQTLKNRSVFNSNQLELNKGENLTVDEIKSIMKSNQAINESKDVGLVAVADKIQEMITKEIPKYKTIMNYDFKHLGIVNINVNREQSMGLNLSYDIRVEDMKNGLYKVTKLDNEAESDDVKIAEGTQEEVIAGFQEYLDKGNQAVSESQAFFIGAVEVTEIIKNLDIIINNKSVPFQHYKSKYGEFFKSVQDLKDFLGKMSASSDSEYFSELNRKWNNLVSSADSKALATTSTTIYQIMHSVSRLIKDIVSNHKMSTGINEK